MEGKDCHHTHLTYAGKRRIIMIKEQEQTMEGKPHLLTICISRPARQYRQDFSRDIRERMEGTRQFLIYFSNTRIHDCNVSGVCTAS